MQHRAIVTISAAALTLVSLPHASLAQARNVAGSATTVAPETSRVFDKEVRELLKEAFSQEKAGHQDKALEMFEQAHAEGKSAATEAELGLAELRAQHYITAARHLASCLKNYQLRVLARSENHILDKLEEAKKHVGTLNVRVNVPKSIVTVDGEVVREWPFLDQIFVEPGKHDVKAMRLGYFMSHTEVPIEAGQTKEVRFALQERERETVFNVRKPMDLNVNTTAVGEKEAEWTKPLLLISSAVLAVSVGTLALGLVKTGTANDEWTSYNEDSWCHEPANIAECKSKKDEAAANRTMWSNVAIAGGIGAGISLAGLIVAIASKPSAPAQVTIQPIAGRDEVGGAVVGRF